jgi:hypothetical protein
MLNDTEKLAIAQALYSAVANYVSTKNPDSMRGRFDSAMLEAYEEHGTKSREMRVNGKKVGNASVRVSKEKTTTFVVVDDPVRFVKWAKANSDMCQSFALDMPERFAAWALDETGEVPDGCRVVEEHKPEQATGVTLRIDPAKVMEAMGPALPQAAAELLGRETV